VTPYLRVEQVAELVGTSVRTLQARAAAGTVPHRRVSGTRRLLFLPDEIAAWIDGAELETIKTAGGGRVVRPK
jgi:excisionase family DNA binding protein